MAGTTMGAAFGPFRGLFDGRSVVALEDAQLLDRFRAGGDEAAFEALIGRHGPMVLTTCRAVLRDEHDVEDAFQATFLVLAQKAGSVRGSDALGGWLHRVAHRASVRAGVESARRRRKEAEAARLRIEAATPGRSSDLAALLHDEIDRLPESLRLPVVLCDLEGLSYDEAARQLRWTLPTLRHRLARARQELKDRLIRRGQVAPAVATLGPVPTALAGKALSAALGQSTPAGATILAHIISRGMLMMKIKLASTAALAAIALATVGIAAGRAREGPGPGEKPAGRPAPIAEVVPDAGSGGVVEVTGRVVAPDGRPVAGARVTPDFGDSRVPPPSEVVSGPDGQFVIRLPRSRRQAGTYPPDLYPRLVASAPGHGPGWAIGVIREGVAVDPVIRLVEPGPTVEGRLIDLEGRPVVGASVRTHLLYFAPGQGGQADESGDLSAWLKGRRTAPTGRAFGGLAAFRADGLEDLATTTGVDGRFRLAGLGRERVAYLLVTGPTIASTQVLVMTRDTPEVRSVEETFLGPKPVVFHSPRFDQPIAPCKPVRGIARDKDTGRPIAGLTIRADVYHPQKLTSGVGIEATTDAEGHYDLRGLPKAPAYRIFVRPGEGLPCMNAVFEVEATASPALDPVPFDFVLKRGVVIRGRVTDLATGRPVAGHVNAFTFADSPGIGDYPGLAQSSAVFAYLDDDGRYEVVAPAGRIIVACQSDLRRYVVGRGVEGIAVRGPKKVHPEFDTMPRFRGTANYHALKEIHPDPGAESATCDLQVDPGRTVELRVEDPEGRPIGDLRAEGTSSSLTHLPVPIASSTVEVRGLVPAQPRRVVVFHDARKLVGSTYLDGDEGGPRTLRLQPWGVVTGRVVDDEEKPARPRSIMAGNNSPGTPPEQVGVLRGATIGDGIRLDRDGRFRLDGLVPGLKHAATALDGVAIVGDLFKDVVVTPGEVKDLGDLKVTPYRP